MNFWSCLCHELANFGSNPNYFYYCTSNEIICLNNDQSSCNIARYIGRIYTIMALYSNVFMRENRKGYITSAALCWCDEQLDRIRIEEKKRKPLQRWKSWPNF